MNKYYYYRLQEKICERMNALRIIQSSVGYKILNVSLLRSSEYNITHNINNDTIVILEPKQLFLSIDLLKDKYSLLGCNILCSPHYNFMVALENEKPLKDTDYINRYKNGTLDARFPHIAKDYAYFKDKYKKMKILVTNNNIEPVSVYKIGTQYYIKDGKHRAALCALLNKPIPCRVLDEKRMIGGVGSAVKRLIGTNTQYSKHILLFDILNKI